MDAEPRFGSPHLYMQFMEPLGTTDGSVAAGDTMLFRDPTKPADDRIRDLIARLTLEERAMLLNHKGTTVQRFDIRVESRFRVTGGNTPAGNARFFPRKTAKDAFV